MSSFRDFKLKKRKLCDLLPESNLKTNYSESTSSPVCLSEDSSTPDYRSTQPLSVAARKLSLEDDDSSSGVGTSVDDVLSCRIRDSCEGGDDEDGAGSDGSRTSSGISIGNRIASSSVTTYNSSESSDSAYDKIEGCLLLPKDGQKETSEGTVAAGSFQPSVTSQAQCSTIETKPKQSISGDKRTNPFNDAPPNKQMCQPQNISPDSIVTSTTAHGVEKQAALKEEVTNKEEQRRQPKDETNLVAQKRFAEFTNQVQSEAKRDASQPKMMSVGHSLALHRAPSTSHNNHPVTPYMGFGALISPLSQRPQVPPPPVLAQYMRSSMLASNAAAAAATKQVQSSGGTSLPYPLMSWPPRSSSSTPPSPLDTTEHRASPPNSGVKRGSPDSTTIDVRTQGHYSHGSSAVSSPVVSPEQAERQQFLQNKWMGPSSEVKNKGTKSRNICGQK